MTLHADHCTHRPGPVQPSSENLCLPLNESQPRHAQRDTVQKARDLQHSIRKGHLHQSPPSRRRVCAERRWEIFRGTGDGWFQSTVFQTQGNRHTNMLTEVWQAHETCRLQTVSRGVDIWSHLPPRAICNWSLLPQGMHFLLTGAARPRVGQLTQTKLQVLVFEGGAHKGFFCSFFYLLVFMFICFDFHLGILFCCCFYFWGKEKKRIWPWVASTLENLKVVKRENLIKI